MEGDEACDFLAHLDTLYPDTHKLLVIRPDRVDGDAVAHAVEFDSHLPALICGHRVHFDDPERVALHIDDRTDAVLLSRRSASPCNKPYSLIVYVLIVIAATAVLYIVSMRNRK